MKIKNIIFFWLILLQTNQGLADIVDIETCQLTQALELNETKPAKDILVKFDYTNESLINIINRLAASQNINVLYPSDLSKIDIAVSLNIEEKITLQEAWKLINTFLEIVGFSLVPKGVSYEIVTNKDVNKEPLATYINIHPEKLPADDSKIRYLYYFQNINLSAPNNKSKANLEVILKDMLSGPAGSNNYIFDTKANCLIITNKTSNIKSVMHIIMSLDQEGFREAIEIVTLKHTNAKNISELLSKVIDNKKSGAQYRYGAPTNAGEEELYFSKNTSIVPIERSNSIAVMGKVDAVEKIINFIVKYLDVAVEGGKSIIHIKELQHVDAGELAKVLQKIIRARIEGAQSTSQKDALSEVIITAEQDEKIEQIKQLEIKKNGLTQNKNDQKNTNLAGNNSLVIAAREPEWQVIEKLIDDIDKPQQQVAIEALIVDLIITDSSKTSSQTRNLNGGFNLPQSANYQSGQIGGPVLNYIPTTVGGVTTYVPTPQGLASDLLTAGQLANKTTGELTNQLVNIVNKDDKGAMLISFSDGNGIASLLEILQGYTNAKILSQPFVTTRNHQQAAMTSSTVRIVRGSVQEQSVGGPAIIKRDEIRADLKVDILPRISKSGNINLEIIVHASEFESESLENNTILTRKLQTNANLSEKQVIVVGGLTRLQTTNIVSGLPILSKIPLLGDLFKKRSQLTSRSTLMVFISPKIIKPRRGISKFVRNKINEAMSNINTDEMAFDNLADPITRILFKSQADESNAIINDFADQVIFGDAEDMKASEGPISSKIK